MMRKAGNHLGYLLLALFKISDEQEMKYITDKSPRLLVYLSL